MDYAIAQKIVLVSIGVFGVLGLFFLMRRSDVPLRESVEAEPEGTPDESNRSPKGVSTSDLSKGDIPYLHMEYESAPKTPICVRSEAPDDAGDMGGKKARPDMQDCRRKYSDWYVEVESSDSWSCHGKDEIGTSLRENILKGEYTRTSKVAVHVKDKEGKWQKTESTLFEFAKGNFSLRILFQPVWSHAMAGLKWGAMVGIGLKLLDTLILLGSVDPALAIMFLVAIGICFIPRFGFGAVIMFLIITAKYTEANFFMMGIAAALTGSILGCLPGMAIGGVIGFCRSNSLERAKDHEESGGLFAKAVLLPAMGGGGLFAFYLFVVNPWIVSILE